ncbi:hypothetical protein HRbin36_00134 [bacterium HR36]|nr:hypothetical protein HRbin36_00134 [bacterium HR36]
MRAETGEAIDAASLFPRLLAERRGAGQFLDEAPRQFLGAFISAADFPQDRSLHRIRLLCRREFGSFGEKLARQRVREHLVRQPS